MIARLRSVPLAALAAVLVFAPGAEARHLPTYHSPGYAGTKKLPKVAPVRPPKPVYVPGYGEHPSVLVDDAGTAHLSYDSQVYTPSIQPSVLHYCRILRGGSHCTAHADINLPYTDENGPQTLRVGNELLLLDSRFPGVVTGPDGSTTDSPDYLFTSEDGGSSFTGPGLIGTTEPSGNAVIYGGSDPSVGIITDTQTGGTVFQGVNAGSFTHESANLSVGDNDAYDGRVAVDGTRPIAAFDDDGGGITRVREWTGRGSVNDPANWTLLNIPHSFRPRIVSGPSGILLMSNDDLIGGSLYIRHIAPGGTRVIGAPQKIVPYGGTGETSLTNLPEIAEGAGGRVVIAYGGSVSSTAAAVIVTSADGRHWTKPSVIARGKGGYTNSFSVGVTADGGGFVAFEDDSRGLFPTARVGIAQFGPAGPTGKKGLGLLGGGSGPPDADKTAYTSCTKVHFGDIDALAEEGCFLRDPSDQTSGAAVTSGTIRLNGLEIVPDAGAKIAIDPHRKTINTTGDVKVELVGTGLGPIVLWHGELHVSLGADTTGTTLFDFDTAQYTSALEGFPFAGRIQVKLEPDAVDIPVHLSLPSYFGGVTGDADLKANNTDGLVLDSLHIGIDDANVGVLELKGVHLDYTRAGSVWDGGGELLLPGPLSPDIKAEVRFEQGAFKRGDLSLSLTPGIPVFEDVYLHDIALGFGLHPTVIDGQVSVGLYAGAGNYPLDVVGKAHIQVGDATHPTVVAIGGTGQIEGLSIDHASFTYDSDGYVLFHVDTGIDADVLSVKGSGDVFVVHGDFGANLDVHGCIAGLCAGLQAAASPKGLSVCAGEGAIKGGADLPDWDPTRIDIHLLSCDLSDYAIQAPPAGVSRAGVRGRAAAVGDRTFAVARGQSVVDVELQGLGGVPHVVLVAPDGKVSVPASPKTRGASVVAVGDAKRGKLFLGLKAPRAGTWTVRTQPGSAPVAALATAHALRLPTVRARVTGHGAVRTLRFRLARVSAGARVQFAERTREGMLPLGKAVRRSGTLRFRPGAGPGGRRSVIAIVTQNGYTRAQPTVAHYTAPRLRRPGRLSGLRIARAGTRLTVRLGHAAGASRYLVRVSATGGLATQRTTTRHTLRLRGLRRGAKITVTVRGVNVRGARGPAITRRIGYPRPKAKHRRRRR